MFFSAPPRLFIGDSCIRNHPGNCGSEVRHSRPVAPSSLVIPKRGFEKTQRGENGERKSRGVRQPANTSALPQPDLRDTRLQRSGREFNFTPGGCQQGQQSRFIGGFDFHLNAQHLADAGQLIGVPIRRSTKPRFAAFPGACLFPYIPLI